QQGPAGAFSRQGDPAMRHDGRAPAGRRAMLSTAIATFIIGEYPGLDMRGPILPGSPDEDYSVFLGTQIADETRHTRAVFRMGAEVLGLDENPRAMLAQAWGLATPAHTELALLEGRIVRGVHERPMDYGSW